MYFRLLIARLIAPEKFLRIVIYYIQHRSSKSSPHSPHPPFRLPRPVIRRRLCRRAAVNDSTGTAISSFDRPLSKCYQRPQSKPLERQNEAVLKACSGQAATEAKVSNVDGASSMETSHQ
ncbi:hypothetical protein Droror1_Dr00011115 [Drosera rotundifolia]